MVEVQGQDLVEQIKTRHKVNHEQTQLPIEEDLTILKTRTTVAPTHLLEMKTAAVLTHQVQVHQEAVAEAMAVVVVAEARQVVAAEAVADSKLKLYK